MRSQYGAEKVEQDLSRYFMSDEIGQVYRGMMVALPAEEWAIFGEMDLGEYVATALHDSLSLVSGRLVFVLLLGLLEEFVNRGVRPGLFCFRLDGSTLLVHRLFPAWRP